MADVLTVNEVRHGPNDIPYIIVQVQWDIDTVDRPYVRVMASYDLGGHVNTYILRGSAEAHPGDGITTESRTYADPQAPFGFDITYTPQWASDPVVADWQDSAWDVALSVPDTVTMEEVGLYHVLSEPGGVENTLLFEQSDNAVPRSNSAVASLLRVQGRRFPVALWDVRTSDSGTLDLRMRTIEDLRAFGALTDDGDPVLSRHGHMNTHSQSPREVIHIGQVSRVYEGDLMGNLVTVEFTEIGDPEPYKISSVGTFAEMQAVFNAALTGDTRLVLLGGTNDTVSTPDNAAFDILGDIDMRMDLAPENFTSGGFTQELITRWNPTGNQRSYRMFITSAGNLGIGWSTNGTASAARTSIPIPTASPRLQVRAVLDVSNAGNHVVTFYTRAAGTLITDHTGWEQLGDPSTTAGAVSIFNGNSPVFIGASANTVFGFGKLDGSVYDAAIYNGIAGTLVARPNFADQLIGAPSFVDPTGKTWTLNGTSELTAAYTMDDITGYFSGVGLENFADIAAYDWWTEANA